MSSSAVWDATFLSYLPEKGRAKCNGCPRGHMRSPRRRCGEGKGACFVNLPDLSISVYFCLFLSTACLLRVYCVSTACLLRVYCVSTLRVYCVSTA